MQHKSVNDFLLGSHDTQRERAQIEEGGEGCEEAERALREFSKRTADQSYVLLACPAERP